jgi:hypothetical protein
MKQRHYKKVAKKKKAKSRKILSHRTAPKKRIVKVVKRKRRKGKPATVFTDTPTPVDPPWPPLTATELEQQAGREAVEHTPPVPIPPDVAESVTVPTAPDDPKDT